MLLEIEIVIVEDFFFSSRRRHTSYIGDWSSDVCSSDLVEIVRKVGVGREHLHLHLLDPAVGAEDERDIGVDRKSVV